MKRTLLLLTIALVAPAVVHATTATANAELQAGLVAHHRGDYQQAFADFRQLAAQGNADAEAHLGGMYSNGQGVPQDIAKAMKWYRLAAAQGNADAEALLGALYTIGRTPLGRGVPKNYAKALKWYRLAAAQGEADAEFGLGMMYTNGQGVPQDYVAAYKWYLIAKATMSATSPYYAVVSNNVKQLAARMTPAQIAQAQQEAFAWYAAHEHAGRVP